MSVKDKAKEAQDRLEDAARAARDKTVAAYEGTREKAIAAYDKSREGVVTARKKTGDGIDEAPLLALGGGLALGLLIGALLPRSEREKQAMKDVGGKLNDRAHTAFDAAKSAGQSTLEEKGITANAAENVVRDVVKGIGSAARRSAEAAKEAAKK